MFGHITDFAFQRTRKQALGFYLTYLLVLALLSGIIVFLYLFLTGSLPVPKVKSLAEGISNGQDIARHIVPYVIFLASMALAGLLIRAKNLYTVIGFSCVLLAALLSNFGALLSLVPIAYLTTLPKSTSQGS